MLTQSIGMCRNRWRNEVCLLLILSKRIFSRSLIAERPISVGVL